MRYDPVKNIIGRAVRNSVVLRKLLYKLLGLLFLREWYVKRELRRVFRLPDPPQSVMDAGSGFGQYTYFVATRFSGVKVYAVDVKAEQIDDCRAFFQKAGVRNVEFHVEDLTAMNHSERFDLILSVDVMEHIADDATVFRNFHRALKQGGVVLINTPSNLGGSDVHAPDDTSFIEEHARAGYGVDELRTKLESAGFMVERIVFSYGRWGSMAWRLGIKYPMLMLNATKLLFIVLPFYYIFVLPIVLPLMYLDYVSKNKTGTGLLVVAGKKKN